MGLYSMVWHLKPYVYPNANRAANRGCHGRASSGTIRNGSSDAASARVQPGIGAHAEKSRRKNTPGCSTFSETRRFLSKTARFRHISRTTGAQERTAVTRKT